MRWKVPDTADARVCAAVVFARPGTGEKRGGERAAQCFLPHDGVLVDGRHSIKQALRVGQLVIVQVVGHRLSLHARSDALPV